MAPSAADSDRTNDREHHASIVREESRHVLESQLAVLRETDRKAMATARVVAVILGLLLSAASLADAPGDSLNRWHVAGSASLLGSLIVAVMTYSVDRPSLGIGSGYLDTADQRLESGDSVEADLLHRYAEWIADNNREIGSNSTYLLVSQWLLVIGLAAVAVGMFRLL
ncbi:hypothetical protein GCM10028857_24170 [Salinarchaeum chitinilyticum]